MDIFKGQKKKFLQPVLNPAKMPGYSSRFAKLGDVAPQLHSLSRAMSENDDVGYGENLRKKFVTGTDERTLPGVILRRRGLK